MKWWLKQEAGESLQEKKIGLEKRKGGRGCRGWVNRFKETVTWEFWGGRWGVTQKKNIEGARWKIEKRRKTEKRDENIFFFLLWVLRKVSKREFWREAKVETKSNEGGFVCLRLLGGKLFTIKYPLPSAFLSFSIVEACWMLWHGHQMPIYFLLILGMDVMSCILSFYWFLDCLGWAIQCSCFIFIRVFLDWFERCSSFTSHAFDFCLKSSWFQPPVQACWSKHETGFYSMTCSFTLSPPSLLNFCCSLSVFGTHLSWEY